MTCYAGDYISSPSGSFVSLSTPLTSSTSPTRKLPAVRSPEWNLLVSRWHLGRQPTHRPASCIMTFIHHSPRFVVFKPPESAQIKPSINVSVSVHVLASLWDSVLQTICSSLSSFTLTAVNVSQRPHSVTGEDTFLESLPDQTTVTHGCHVVFHLLYIHILYVY